MPLAIHGVSQFMTRRVNSFLPSLVGKGDRLRWMSFDYPFRRGFYILARRAGIVAEAPPVADEARRGWRSGQNRSALQADKRFWEPQEGKLFPVAEKESKTRFVTPLYLPNRKSPYALSHCCTRPGFHSDVSRNIRRFCFQHNHFLPAFQLMRRLLLQC